MRKFFAAKTNGILWVLVLFFLYSHVGEAQKSTFKINATGTTAELDSAMRYAVSIWGSLLTSPVPIKINVVYTSFIVNVPTLASTFPNGRKNFNHTPLADTWYPTALANALNRSELNPGEYDMDIYVNADKPWYAGKDSHCPADKYDLVSVFLHEVGHGLGFASLANVKGDAGSFGSLTSADYFPLRTSFPFPDLEGLPSAFDRAMQNDSGEKLTDTVLFQNNSPSLKEQFTSTDVFLSSGQGQLGNGGNMPKVYAPNSFTLGVSMTHLDEDSYGNMLMTPFFDKGSANHQPSGLELGILADLGWNSEAPLSLTDGLRVVVSLQIKEGAVPLEVQFLSSDKEEASLHIYELSGKELATKQMDASETSWKAPSPGIYYYTYTSGLRNERGKFSAK